MSTAGFTKIKRAPVIQAGAQSVLNKLV